MGRKVTNLILLLILLAGLSLLLYPTVADWWNQFHSSRAIASYSEKVEAIDDGESQRMWDEATAYNQALVTRPSRFLPTEAEHAEYESLLDVTGTGIMGYIEIPCIGVSLPIYHGTADTVLQIAAGHIEGTSLPVGGLGTHCVISGHRGLPSAKLFTDLDQMAEGDIFMLRVLNETLTYKVDQIRIVLPEEVNELRVDPMDDLCTLVTCTPYGVNTHRLLVRGYRIDNLEEAQELIVEMDAVQVEPMLVAAGIAAPILLIMLVGILLPKRRRRQE